MVYISASDVLRICGPELPGACIFRKIWERYRSRFKRSGTGPHAGRAAALTRHGDHRQSTHKTKREKGLLLTKTES